MKPVNLQFYIDVSGVPYETTYVGVIVSTPQIIDRVLKDLKKQKNLFSKKARQLKGEELFKVLSIMNEKDLKMFTTKFTHKNWEQAKETLGKKKNFKNKYMGYIYYQLIRQQYLYKNFSYHVFTCSDDHLNINEVHKNCKLLAKADKTRLSFSIATANVNDGVRLADYVAQALKKNRIKKLQKLNNLKCIKIEKDKRLLEKII